MYSVTNNSKAEQGIWTDKGLAFVGPGETKSIAIREDYIDRAKSLPFLTVKDGGPLDHDGDGEAGGSLEHEPPALTGKNKAELLEIAAEEGVEIEEGAKNADIIAAIELAREG